MRSCGAVDGRLLVALSGGVDSAVLLAIAVDALGADRVVGVTGRSASLAGGEAEAARMVAAQVGCAHRVIDTEELDDAAYRANRGDRCFHCRTELFGRLRRIARDERFAAIAYGAIVDDLGDVRPGMRAADEFAVLAPLLDAGFTKADVRAAASARRLVVSDKPASACLASRIPVGSEVTAKKLGQVERAESSLKRFGFGQFRVRHHGSLARIEFDADGLALVADPEIRERVVAAVREAGFRRVTIDARGYRSGGAGTIAAPERLYSIGPTRDGGQ